MDNKLKLKNFIAAALTFSIAASGCTAKDDSITAESTSEAKSHSQLPDDTSSEAEEISEKPSEPTTPVGFTAETGNIFSDRDISGEYDSDVSEIVFNGDSAEIKGSGAVFADSVLTVSEAGTYIISGSLNNGRIVVDSAEKVQLVLDNAYITCTDNAPVYVKAADKVFITAADGTLNSLTDGTSYTYEAEGENEPDAVIFSHDSLTINGKGTLNINACYNEGIACKDDIVIAGCTLNINSVGNGIKGKDYVAVNGAALNVTSQEDGIKSTNIEDEGMGFVYVKDGSLTINSQEDAIQTDTEFIAEGGTFNIVSGGGAVSAEPRRNNDFEWNGGRENRTAETDSVTETTISKKGIKGAELIYISGGTFNIDSADDSLHSNGAITVTGGNMTLNSGDDGLHSDSQINISGGELTIERSYEGIEAADITVSGGIINVTASDDGFNASDGTSQGGLGRYSDAMLTISGGIVHVNADGDGLDSNGDMLINDGLVLVNGPTNSGNGALDGNGEIACNGGILVAAGSSGMAEAPTLSSKQYSVSAAFETQHQGGTLVTLCDSDGNEILSFAPSKSFNHIVISTPEITKGQSYSINLGGTSTANESNGFYEVGGYNSDAAEKIDFTADEITTYSGSQGMMGGGFGGGGFGGGKGDFEPPEMPTNGNGEIQIPKMPEGGFGGGNRQPPTDENGDMRLPPWQNN